MGVVLVLQCVLGVYGVVLVLQCVYGVVLVLQCVLGVYGGTRLCVGAEWEMCECVEVNEPHRLRCQLSHLPLMSGGAQIRPQHPIPPLTKKHFHFKREK